MQVVVARIGRPHGLSGEVSVEVRTDDPDRRLAPGLALQTDPAPRGPLRIVAGRVHSGRLLLRFAGIDDRAAAEALRNLLLVVEVDPLERPEDPEEFYDHQLVGLGVRTQAGEQVGTIAEVLHLPGQDVLAVRRGGGAEVLVPFVADIVPTVDLDSGFVVVTPPPGLLDPQAELAADRAASDSDASPPAGRFSIS